MTLQLRKLSTMTLRRMFVQLMELDQMTAEENRMYSDISQELVIRRRKQEKQALRIAKRKAKRLANGGNWV